MPIAPPWTRWCCRSPRRSATRGSCSRCSCACSATTWPASTSSTASRNCVHRVRRACRRWRSTTIACCSASRASTGSKARRSWATSPRAWVTRSSTSRASAPVSPHTGRRRTTWRTRCAAWFRCGCRPWSSPPSACSATSACAPGSATRPSSSWPPTTTSCRCPNALRTSPSPCRENDMDMPSLAQQALAALAVPSQHARLIQLDAPVSGLVVERFEGHEAVCAPFHFAIDVLATSAFLSPDALLGQPLGLRLRQAGGGDRRWHGLCTAVAPLGADGGLARYRLTVEPWTALLTHRRNALVFQDLDTRGVLEQVFADYPQAAFRFDVTRTLPVRAITTQYRESDWDFATRLLAEAGLAWRFEHAQPGEGEDDSAGHTLVVFDQQAELPAGETVRFHRIDATEGEDAISAFAEQRQLVPGRMPVGRWHSEQLASVTGQADADSGKLPVLEVFVQPRAGRFAEGEHADAEATHRLDALRVPHVLHAGAGSARDLSAGRGFTLARHPNHDGQGFVPLHVVHVAVNNLGHGITALLAAPDLERGSYRNRFVAAPLGTPLAPLPRARPTVHGPQTARVVGLPEAALTPNRDHQVRLQFFWQRGPAPNAGGLTDTASQHPGHAPGDATSGTWVSVAEWIAGPNWGSHFLPRVGAEVLVEFLHGDIDQPRVTGQLYNG